MHFYSPEGEKIRNIKQLKNRTMHIFACLRSRRKHLCRNSDTLYLATDL